MGTFSGSLNQNEIYSALYNMIISQQVFDRIGDSGELVDEAKVDGGLYGDTKLFYAADVLPTSAWGNDNEAANLLSLDRPAAPECQAIVLNKFRQIRLTLDDYLSKRAWSDEGSFGQFNSLMEGMVGKSKRIYDVTTYNAFIGTDEVAAQDVTVTIDTGETPEGEVKKVAKAVADIIAKMKNVSRAFNEYGHMTKFDEGEIKIIWNSAFLNKFRKVDMPAIFHNEGLVDKLGDRVLFEDYFGDINSSQKTADANTYALVEQTITYNNVVYHYFPGEKIATSHVSAAGCSYQKTTDVICRIYVKLPAYMSAFEVGTTFFNPRSLTTNRYLTFGHNTLEHFKAYPCVTLVEAVDANSTAAVNVNVVNSTSDPVNTKEVSA